MGMTGDRRAIEGAPPICPASGRELQLPDERDEDPGVMVCNSSGANVIAGG